MSAGFERSAEDVGNVVSLEHVNVKVADQSQAHVFYVSGMGFTRDPYIDFGLRNMWINLGKQQFHLPVGEPQVLRGETGIVTPSLEELEGRLARVAPLLEGSKLAWQAEADGLRVTCPWGNTLRVSESGPTDAMRLGMPYVRFDVAEGTAAGIVRFYQQILDTPARVADVAGSPTAVISVGGDQRLEFRETDAPAADYDGHHIAIYVADFSGPHRRLLERGLVSEESNPVQYRFEQIADPDTGEPLFVIEHEVRSMTHPMYARPLVNRNARQNNINYLPGQDAF